MERIGFMGSEEMSFENVDGRRTDNGCLPILKAHLPMSQLKSLHLYNFFHCLINNYLNLLQISICSDIKSICPSFF